MNTRNILTRRLTSLFARGWLGLTAVGLTISAMPLANPLGPVPALTGCPIPVTIFESKLLSSTDGKSRYEVKWSVDSSLLPCVTIKNFEVKVTHQYADHVRTGTKTVSGNERQAVIEADNDSGSSLRNVIFDVVGVPASNAFGSITFDASQMVVPPEGRERCKISLSFITNFRNAQLVRLSEAPPPLQGSPPATISLTKYGVKVEWTVAEPLLACVKIDQFELAVKVSLSDNTILARTFVVPGSARDAVVPIGALGLAAQFKRVELVSLTAVPKADVSIAGHLSSLNILK